MEIQPGQGLLHYRVLAKLGQGGMGEVWRAEDTKLGREVAIKVLPPNFAADPERKARFEREARMLAALDHPGIAAIYGLEQIEGRQLLVMQLVEGETLEERMDRSGSRASAALPARAALEIAAQIAEALEAAHEKGIIHRDLKPANVKLTHDGSTKLLDFGLARALDTAPRSDGHDPTHSPTMTSAGTAMGMILGTAAYMSPEQAAGQPVDRRCDIWSFGVVLFEMLSGRRLFQGETISHTLADVLRAELDFNLLPKNLPSAVRHLLERCLDRNPKRRLRDIGEARVLLRDVLENPAKYEEAAPAGVAPTAAAPPRARRLSWLVAAAALVFAAAATIPHLLEEEPAPRPARRFTMKSPYGGNFRADNTSSLALSPDGMVLVSQGFSGAEDTLYVRKLTETTSHPLLNTSSSQPFFSPDGKWLGFVSTLGLFKINLGGGAPIKIATFPTVALGATWSDDGYVYFSTSGSILRVPESGGASEKVVEPDRQAGELMVLRPCALPRGRGILFDSRMADRDTFMLHAYDPQSGQRKSLGLQGTHPIYAKSGHLLYHYNNRAFVVPFDPVKLEPRGDPIAVHENVRAEQNAVHLAVADDGTLAYLPTRAVKPRLVLVDRRGVARPLVTTALPFSDPSDVRFSPDGTRLAVTSNGIWIVDLDSGIPTLVSEDGFYPVWSPDGQTLVYGVAEAESYDLKRRPTDLAVPETLLLDRANNLRSATWAADGSLIFREEIQDKGMDLRVLAEADLDNAEKAARPLLETPHDELAPAISPDGRLMVFVSNQSGRDEIYVTTFPAPTGLTQVSLNGGTSPSWSPDGRELYYTEGFGMVAVKVATSPAFRVQGREVLFTGDYLQYRWQRQYDVHPRTGEFLMIESPPGGADVEIVLDWFTEIEKLVPTAD